MEKSRLPCVRNQSVVDAYSEYSSDSDSEERIEKKRRIREAHPEELHENTLGERSRLERNLKVEAWVGKDLQDLETFPNGGLDTQGRRMACGLIALNSTTSGQTIDRAKEAAVLKDLDKRYGDEFETHHRLMDERALEHMKEQTTRVPKRQQPTQIMQLLSIKKKNCDEKSLQRQDDREHFYKEYIRRKLQLSQPSKQASHHQSTAGKHQNQHLLGA